MPRTVEGLIVAAAWLSLAGCLQRSDFVPPPPPEPLRLLAPGAEASAPQGPLTAAEAVRLALVRNPDLRMAEARIAQARARLAESNSSFLPRVSADLTYLHGDAPSAYLFKRIDARSLPPNVDFNDPGSFSNLEGGLGLVWNLWNGGRDLLGRWSADAALAASGLARDAAGNALVAAVVATYLDARATRELGTADDASVATMESQVAESRAKVEGGGALRSDLLSLEVRLAEAREQRFRSETAERLALAALRELLALPADAPLELADADYDVGTLPATFADALAQAYRSRPEAAIARRAVERARIELASARRAYLPRVDVISRFYADVPVDLGFDVKDPNYTVAVALSFDVFDGGAREAAVASARAALDELTEADRKALLAVAREVETAYLRLDESRARYQVAAQAVDAADETLQLVEVQYRGGAATVTRYLEAESARARARTAKIQARLDLERAKVEAQRAIGGLYPLARHGGETQ
ncbi:MAG: TolC family protein [Thermodesulfobacteriota bacterium]